MSSRCFNLVERTHAVRENAAQEQRGVQMSCRLMFPRCEPRFDIIHLNSIG